MPDVNPSLNTRFRMFPLLPQLLCSAGRFCDAVFISGGQTPPLSTPLLGAWALPRGSLTLCFLSALLQFWVSRLVSNPPELVFVCSVTRGPPWPLRQLTCGCPVPQHRLLKRPSFPSKRPRPLPEVVRPGARGFISGCSVPVPGPAQACHGVGRHCSDDRRFVVGGEIRKRGASTFVVLCQAVLGVP